MILSTQKKARQENSEETICDFLKIGFSHGKSF